MLALFVSHENVDRCTLEVPMFADLVLEIASIGVFDPLGKVAEEYERRDLCAFEHRDIFDFNIFAFVAWWRIGGDVFLQDGVELRGRHRPLAVFVYIDSSFDDFKDALFCQCRCEYYGKVDKGGEAVADGGFIVLDGRL